MSTENQVAQAALDYLNAGWQPIPVPSRSKNPGRDDWQLERWTAEDVPQRFTVDKNIGLILGAASNGLCDCDLDSPEAIALAPVFLSKTTFISGHASAEKSHYWYRCSPVPESLEFRDVDNKKKFLELRANGRQTIVPPSLHKETGEEIVWYEAEGTPATLSGSELTNAMNVLGAATLLARQPAAKTDSHSRHDLAMCTSGFLLRQPGWNEARVSQLVGAVASAAGDEEIEDRLTAVKTTAECLAKGERAKGGPALRELLGNAAFEKFCEWLGFAKSARFEVLPTVEADKVALDEIPDWPVDTLEGDFIADLTFQLYHGTYIPPEYIRESIVQILGAVADGRLGYPLQHDLVIRRYLALISELPQCGKGQTSRRLTKPPDGALLPLISASGLKMQNGTGIGSGEFLAKKLQEFPRMICHWDEGSALFAVSGHQHSRLLSDIKSLLEDNESYSGSFTNKEHGTDDAHFSVLLNATRKTFVDGFALARGAGDGLLSRFTLVYSAGLPRPADWEPRNFSEEKQLAAKIEKLLPQSAIPVAPKITDAARDCIRAFAAQHDPITSPNRLDVARLVDLTKVDLLHRCIYSGSQEITREMAERSAAWGNHQLALRLALWPPDAPDKVAAMNQVLLRRLRKGTAADRDLRIAANVRDAGLHDTYVRARTALLKSGQIIVSGHNRVGKPVYALADEEL